MNRQPGIHEYCDCFRLGTALADLGNINAARILAYPPPGTATLDDVTRANGRDGRLGELIDGTLVEKAVGWQESLLSGVLLHWLHAYLDETKLGLATTAVRFTRLLDATVRGPDVAFLACKRLQGRKIPAAPIPDLSAEFGD